ncbi:hypothetical protein ACP70R_024819 [Stipagrostis hirtigluma subsp. patula]
MDAVSSSSPPPLRVVICPWLAFGHLLPYLELAERLALRGHLVSFVSTARNIARLPPLRPAAAPRVAFVALPLPRIDGLPGGAESTNDIPHEFLWEAFDGLAAPFEEFLAAACADGDRRPDWIIADTFHHWAAAAAIDHKVPCAMLLPTAALMAGWTSGRPATLFEIPPTAEDRPAAVPPYEWEQKARFFINLGASAMTIAKRCSLTLERCTVAAMRSCPEWEPEPFQTVATLLGKPVAPLGLLPPSPDGDRRATTNGGDDATLRWLDAQPAKSVVYVALGSEVPLSVQQVHRARAGSRAGARRGTLPLGSEKTQWCHGRRCPSSQLPRAHPRPWPRDHGMGSPDQHTGARCRRRIPDALRAELAYRRAYVWTPSDHAANLRGPRAECASDGGEEAGIAGEKG